MRLENINYQSWESSYPPPEKKGNNAATGELMGDRDKELGEAQELLSTGDFSGAVKKFNKVIKADPKCAEAYFGKAEAAIGDPNVSEEDTMACYKKAVELDGKNPLYWSSYASFLMELGRFNEAEAAYTKAAEIDPENSRYYNSEFAVDYAARAPVVMEKFLDDKTREMIKKKALKYLLKSIDLNEEEARKML